MKRAAMDGDGGVSVDEINMRTHLHEGFVNSLHGAEGEEWSPMR
jgi:hypothetical protein